MYSCTNPSRKVTQTSHVRNGHIIPLWVWPELNSFHIFTSRLLPCVCFHIRYVIYFNTIHFLSYDSFRVIHLFLNIRTCAFIHHILFTRCQMWAGDNVCNFQGIICFHPYEDGRVLEHCCTKWIDCSLFKGADQEVILYCRWLI